VFMSNHIHLLATPGRSDSISHMMHLLGSCYARHFNQRYARTGTLWEGRYRSCLIDGETYLLRCYRYIESNPVRADMVSDPSLYKWSSHHCNGYGRDSPLLTPHREYVALGSTRNERLQNYRALFLDELGEEHVSEIRASLNSGLTLGVASNERPESSH
jgi:putative transposase